MQAKNYKMLNTLIQKNFHTRHRSLAIRMILSLEDISLRNIHFANLMQDLSPKQGMMKQLKRLSVSELHVLHLFFKEIQKNCPDCYKANVILILNRIRLLLSQNTCILINVGSANLLPRITHTLQTPILEDKAVTSKRGLE